MYNMYVICMYNKTVISQDIYDYELSSKRTNPMGWSYYYYYALFAHVAHVMCKSNGCFV